MKKAIIELIKRRQGHVSCVELCDSIPGFSGEGAWTTSKNENIVIWEGVSIDAVDAIRELLEEKQITLGPADVLVYRCDGKTLNLPLFTNPKKQYNTKTPHWLPVVVWLYNQMDTCRMVEL